MSSTIVATVTTRDGIVLAVETHGDGPRDLLMLHSFGTDSSVWGPLTAFLLATDPEVRVVTLDARNHGRSARTDEHTSFADAVADVVDAVVALGLRRPLVVGSSLGANVALELAVTRPDLVGGAVLLGCALHAPRVVPALAAGMRDMIAGLRTDPVATAAAVAPNWCGPLVAPAVPDWLARLIPTTGTGAYAVADGVLDYDPRPRLSGVTVPVTYVAGTLDAVPLDVVRECAALTPGSRLEVVDGVAHLPHLEVPGLVCGILSSASATVAG